MSFKLMVSCRFSVAVSLTNWIIEQRTPADIRDALRFSRFNEAAESLVNEQQKKAQSLPSTPVDHPSRSNGLQTGHDSQPQVRRSRALGISKADGDTLRAIKESSHTPIEDRSDIPLHKPPIPPVPDVSVERTLADGAASSTPVSIYAPDRAGMGSSLREAPHVPVAILDAPTPRGNEEPDSTLPFQVIIPPAVLPVPNTVVEILPHTQQPAESLTIPLPPGKDMEQGASMSLPARETVAVHTPSEPVSALHAKAGRTTSDLNLQKTISQRSVPVQSHSTSTYDQL